MTWTAADGVVHVVEVRVPPALRAGSAVTVWLDRTGRVVADPAERTAEAVAFGVSAALAVVALSWAVLSLLWSTVCRLTAARNAAAWAREWARVEPAVAAFGPVARLSDRLARMGYDVRAVRAHFPALAAGAAHFDGPGGSQVPDTVADAVARHPAVAAGQPGHGHRGRAGARTRSCWRPAPRWPTCSGPTRAGSCSAAA